ncbi:MAG: 3-phosphoshikimate 1-carboxyvinyltransferase [Deltaproteobacteria bacterium RIFOXYA12_FULL_58_15]|nr:MAG: 3-phosphoshikimate 1-carboxyvinyltransferase [Deltaproteobacteria bacterium RIFOXYA12_FULL_58_15]OGR12819.1 MAG: 3-phosphoshikimate 1-carboxyvinyltransferase [Deltaproteobacteria bacterium RIFOXYB12_FULL_58_9]
MIEVRVPPSKSLTQRALVLGALGNDPCRIHNPLICDDSEAMATGLTALGVRVEKNDSHWLVHPPETFSPKVDARLHLGNAGTATRFLTGLSPVVRGSYIVDGNEDMHRRPMPSLLAALSSLGVEVNELGNPGCPPVRLDCSDPHGVAAQTVLKAGGSSQELSALLLVGSRMPEGLRITVDGALPSRPYFELTLSVLGAFGVRYSQPMPNTYVVSRGRPRCHGYEVEGDWSSASYPIAAGWLTGREVSVVNASKDSAQGDRLFPSLLETLATAGDREIDMSDVPDLVPTVTACALFAQGNTHIKGAAHLRIKESDRLAGLAGEFKKLGAKITEEPDGLVIEPGPLRGNGAALDSHRDHRLAMAFGLVSLRVNNFTVLTPGCVSKSYPEFWQMLEEFR